MSKRDIIISFIKQFIDNPLPDFNVRALDFQFIKNKNIRKVYTIIGPRRAGKSYFCYQIIDSLLKSGVEKENILYFLLENDELYPLELNDLNVILESYFELTGKIKEKVFIFLDEIQEIPNFEKFVRKVLDTYPNVELIITGSSSKLLSREIDTSLRGRSLSYEILPLSYNEYLYWNNFTGEKKLNKNELFILKNLELKLLKYGSFPEIVIEENENNKTKYIKNYFDLIFYKDVVERNNIKSIKHIKTFRKILLSSIGDLISINSISQIIGVENNTLSNWLNAFLDSYLFFELKSFSFSNFEVETSLSKIYCIDNGFYNTIFSNYKDDYGKIFENQVFLELRKLGLLENENIFYYKNKDFDIDYIVFKDKKITPIQVCYALNEKNIDREVKKFEKFLIKNNLKGYLVIYEDYRSNIESKYITLIRMSDISSLFS